MSSLIKKVLVENAPDNNLFFGLSKIEIQEIKNMIGIIKPKSIKEVFDTLRIFMEDKENLEKFLLKLILKGEKAKDIQEILSRLVKKEDIPLLSQTILNTIEKILAVKKSSHLKPNFSEVIAEIDENEIFKKDEIDIDFDFSNLPKDEEINQSLSSFYPSFSSIPYYESVNLVLDFKDLPKVDEISLDPSIKCSFEYYKQILYKYYITVKLFQQIQAKGIRCKNDFQYFDFKDKSELLKSNQEEYIEEVRSVFIRTFNYLNLIGHDIGFKVRIHLFLDPVEDTALQEVLNSIVDLHYVYVNGYSTKQDLITYSLPHGDDLPKDSFIGFYKGPILGKK